MLCYSEKKASVMADLNGRAGEKACLFTLMLPWQRELCSGAAWHRRVMDENQVSSVVRASTHPALWVRNLPAFGKVAMMFCLGVLFCFCQGKVEKSPYHQYIFQILFLKSFSCHFCYSFSTMAFKGK